MDHETIKTVEAALVGSTGWWIFSSAIATMPVGQAALNDMRRAAEIRRARLAEAAGEEPAA